MTRRQLRRRGISLIETVMASLVVGLLAVGVLTAASQAHARRSLASDITLATLFAGELADEISAKPYLESLTTTLGPDAGETTRSTFDDVDDYDNLAESPLHDAAGNVLTSTAWTRKARVEWVSTLDSADVKPVDSGVKRITVDVYRAGRRVAQCVVVRSRAWDEARAAEVAP